MAETTGGNSGATGGGSAGGSQVENLALGIQVPGAVEAEQALDSFGNAVIKVGTATVRSMNAIGDLNKAVSENAQWLTQAQNNWNALNQSMNAQYEAEQKAIEVTTARLMEGSRYIEQLKETVRTYNMTTNELKQYKAEQLGVGEEAAKLIAQMDAMAEATARYGVVIKNVSQIEKARTDWEATNATALNAQRMRSLNEQAALEEASQTSLTAQRTRALNDQARLEESAAASLNAQRRRAIDDQMKLEESAQTTLNAQRIRALNEQMQLEQSAQTTLNAQRIRALNEQAALEESARTALNAQRQRELNAQAALEESSRTALNAQRIRALNEQAAADKAQREAEERNMTVLQAFKRRTIAENEAAELRAKQEAAAAAVALAEKQAVEEIKWSQLSLKTRINNLRELQAYIDKGISQPTIDNTFSKATQNDLGNLNNLIRQYNDNLGHHGKQLDEVGQKANGWNNILSNSRVRTEGLVLAHELLQGRFTRFGGSLGVMAEYLSAANVPINGMVLGIGALAVGIAGAVFEMVRGSVELVQFNKSMTLTANYAGLTRDSFHDLAEVLHSEVHVSIGKSTEMLNALATSGKISSDVLANVSRTALQFQYLSGQSTEQVAKFFEGLGKTHGKVFNDMQNDIAEWAAKANDQYHFLSAAQYEHIRLLTLQGDKTQAVNMLMDAFSESMDKQAGRVGILVAAYRGWADILSHVAEGLKNLGKDWFNGDSAEETMNKEREKYEKLVADRMKVASRKLPNGQSQLDPEMMAKMDANVKAQLKVFQDAAQAYQDTLLDARKKAELAQANSAGVEAQRSWDYFEKTNRTQKQIADDMVAHVIDNAATINRNNIIAWEARYKGDKAGMAAAEELAIAHGEIELKTADDVAKMIENIRKKHHERVNKIGDDGRRQDLMSALAHEDALLQQAMNSGNAQIKSLQDQYKKSAISQDDFYARSTEARNKELEALEANEKAKLAIIDRYKPKNQADARATAGKRQGVVDDFETAKAKLEQAQALADQINSEGQFDKWINGINKVGEAEVKQVDELTKKQLDHNLAIGKTKEQLDLAKQAQDAATTADLQMQADAIDLLLKKGEVQQYNVEGIQEEATAKVDLDERSKKVYEAEMLRIQKLIAARKAYAQALGEGAVLEAQFALQKKVDAEWARMDKKIGDDLASAIVDGGGKGWKKLIRDMEVAFAKMILQPILAPISAGISSLLYPTATQASGVAGVGGAAAGGSGLGSLVSAAQGASNLYKSVNSGFSAIGSTLGSGVSWVGGQLGSSGMSAFGSGMGMTAEQAAAAQAAYANAGMSSTANAIGYGQTAGSIAASVGGFMAGQSLNHMISGKYEIGSGGQKVETIATAVAAAFNPVAGAIVGGISGLINRAFGRGPTELKDSGLQGTLYAGATVGSTYQNYHQDGGWFRSDKNWTDRKDLDSQTQNVLTSGFTQLEQASLKFASSFGVSEHALDGFTKNFDIKFTNDASKNQQAIADFFTGLGDEIATKLVPTIQQFSVNGETAAATLERLSAEFDATTGVAKQLGVSVEKMFGSAGIDSTAARERLLNYSGGASNLQSQIANYQKNFWTDAERIAPVAKSLDEALNSLGLSSIPQTREQFKLLTDNLVNSGAVATDVGAKQYASLLALSDAFAQVHPDTAEDAANKLSTATNNLKDAYNEQADSLNKVIDKTTSFAKSLRDLNFSTLMGDLSPLTPEQKYAQSKAEFEKTTKAAKNGDEDAQAKFSQVYQDFLAASRVVNASGSNYQSDFQYAQQMAANLATTAEKERDVNKAQLDALNKQVNGLIDINKSVMSVDQAIREFLQAQQGSNKGQIQSLYSSIFGQNASDAQLNYWMDKIGSGTTIDQISSSLRQQKANESTLVMGNSKDNPLLTKLLSNFKDSFAGFQNSLDALRKEQNQQTGATIAAQAQTAEQTAQTIATAITSTSTVQTRVMPS